MNSRQLLMISTLITSTSIFGLGLAPAYAQSSEAISTAASISHSLLLAQAAPAAALET